MIAPLLVLVLTLAGLLLLAGCTVNVGLDTQVETDGSGTVSVRLAADQELQDALSGAAGGLGSLGSLLDIFGGLGDLTGLPGSVDELFDTILGEIPGEWEVERGTDDDGTKWLAMTRPFASPEELEEILASSALSSVVDIESLTLTRDEGVFSTKTLFSTTADVGGAMSQLGEAAVDLPLDLLGQVLVIENRLTLPGTIGDNNADEVQGNTLVWNVGTSGAREMHAESVAYNWAAIVGIIVAGGIVIAALVVALVLIILRRRRPSSPPSPTRGLRARRSARGLGAYRHHGDTRRALGGTGRPGRDAAPRSGHARTSPAHHGESPRRRTAPGRGGADRGSPG